MCGNSPSREIASLRSQRQYIRLIDSSVGYFAYAQYDVLFLLHVILSMSSEQTCLQGFANEDIHKALAFFIKNAENGSFNALALSAE